MKNKYLIILIIAILIIIFMFTVPIIEIVSDIYDIDKDGDIDIFDVQQVFNNIGSTDPIYDVDEDGDVDILDVQSTFNNIGNDPQEEQYTVIDWIVNVEWK